MGSDTSADQNLYEAALSSAVFYDNSKVGRLKATGEDALDLINRLSTNLVLDLDAGQGTHTILTTDRGRILDVINVINTGDHFIILTSPDQQNSVIEWLDKYTIMEDLTVEDLTENTSMISIMGPTSSSIVNNLTGIDVSSIPDYNCTQGVINEHTFTLICRPFADLPNIDLITSNESKEYFISLLSKSGTSEIDNSTFDTLRVEKSLPAYDRELGDRYNPLEAGLIGSFNFLKGCYIGQEVIARLDTYQKIQKRLVKVKFSDNINVEDDCVLTKDGQEVGNITSFGFVPGAGETIGLGYIKNAFAEVGSRLDISNGSEGSAEIISISHMFGPGEA